MKIGFVDDELDNFHANTYLQAIRGPLKDRGFEVAGASALKAPAGAAWCAQHEVPFFEHAGDLAEQVDCVAILAPATPETHLPLCQQVLPAGKPTFVDKTFAPNISVAEEIFALADECGAAVQSTSALRTTNVQAELSKATAPAINLTVWAGGASWHEYGVHPVEILVSCLGADAESVFVTGSSALPTLLICFGGQRTGVIHFNATEHVPFLAAWSTPTETHVCPVNDERLFVDAASAMLDFFAAGKPLVPREQTMAVMRILAAAASPTSRRGPMPL